jgi:hypothetical protein
MISTSDHVTFAHGIPKWRMAAGIANETRLATLVRPRPTLCTSSDTVSSRLEYRMQNCLRPLRSLLRLRLMLPWSERMRTTPRNVLLLTGQSCGKLWIFFRESSCFCACVHGSLLPDQYDSDRSSVDPGRPDQLFR